MVEISAKLFNQEKEKWNVEGQDLQKVFGLPPVQPKLVLHVLDIYRIAEQFQIRSSVHFTLTRTKMTISKKNIKMR